MRTRSLVLLVALTVLIYSSFSVVTATAEKSTMGLDGQAHIIQFSKSVPGQLNYQGFLANASDSSAITATPEMTFRLFDSESKGAELWAETHTAVEVNNGLFQVLLGSVTSFPDGLFDDSEMWLQTEVGTEVLSPRKPIVSVAYSHRTNSAEMLLDNTLTDLDGRWVNEEDMHYLDASDGTPANALYVDGTGKVGIGTTTPLTELDVDGSVNAAIYYGDGSNLTGIAGTPDADWAIDGNNVYHETGNVGIGTTSPAYPLDVNGDAHATTYYGDGSNLTGISGTTDNDWTISGNNVYHMLGNVGIGTASPATKLHVDSEGNTELKMEHDDVKNTISFYADTHKTGYLIKDDDTGQMNISANGSDDQVTIVESNGRVGIGTTNPSTKLDVDGDVNVDSLYRIGGSAVLSTTGSQNIFVGAGAGGNNTGGWVTSVGASAGLNNQGNDNVFVGRRAGYNNSTGGANTYLGQAAGYSNSGGYENTFLGSAAGYKNTTGNYNTFLGRHAGYSNLTGTGNVFVGHKAGYNETGSDKLYIANGSASGDVLISGDFSTGRVGIGKTNPSAPLDVFGHINLDKGGAGGLALDVDGYEAIRYTGPGAGSYFTWGYGATANYFPDPICIGTTSPDARLHIVESGSTNPFRVDVDDSVAFIVTDSYPGRVGIGTEYPGSALTVESPSGWIQPAAVFRHYGSYGALAGFYSKVHPETADDIISITVPSGSPNDFQFIECSRGAFSDTNVFKVNGDGSVWSDGGYTSKADHSEMVRVSSGALSVEPGDVMVIDPHNARAIAKSSQPRSSGVAGIYSTRPGFIGSERNWSKSTRTEDNELETYSLEDMATQFNEIPLAVLGIVPCKVSAENGEVRPGDLLVTSGTPGHAMRDDNPRAGTIVGKALDSLTSGSGVIKVLVTLH